MGGIRRWTHLCTAWAVVCTAFLMASCAVRENFRVLQQQSQVLEQENRHEALVTVYREMLAIEPEDREVKGKYDRLQELLAHSFAEQAQQALKQGRLHSAFAILEHHRSLLPDYPPAPRMESELRETLLRLELLKHQANAALQAGDYLAARGLLNQVAQANREDPIAQPLLDRIVQEGKEKYLNEAHTLERSADWAAARQAYEKAFALSPDSQTRDQLEKSAKAVEALSTCKDAADALDGGQPEKAFQRMKQAAQVFPPEQIPLCAAVQQRIKTAAALTHYQQGVQHEARGEWDKALEEFRTVEELKTGDPATLEHIARVRNELGKGIYARILQLLEQRQFLDAYEAARKLEQVSPDFGEALDLAAEAMARWTEALYQQGLRYSNLQFHATALLYFRAIAAQAPDYLDVQAQASAQWRKVQERGSSRVTLLPFFSRAQDSGLMKEWNNKLFKALKLSMPGTWEIVPEQTTSTPANQRDLLEVIKTLPGETAVCGWVEDINIRRTVSTSLEPLDYTVKEKVLNPRYFQIQNELRLLYNRFQAVLLEEGPRSKSAAEMRQKIDGLEKDLAGTPPLIEEVKPQKAQKNIRTHKIAGTATAAFRVYDVNTVKEVWTRDITEELTLSDEAIDPIPQAGFPGKSVNLPSDEEAKRTLLEQMIVRVQKEMEGYIQDGRLRTFQRAEDSLRQGNTEEALELYGDFLAAGPPADSPQVQRARNILEQAQEAIRYFKPLGAIAITR